MVARIAILFLLVLSSWGSVTAQTREVKRIWIVSNWTGLGPTGHSELVIERKPEGYRAKGKKVDVKMVDDLLASIFAPPVNSPSLTNLGITQAWLNANADDAMLKYEQTAAENLRAIFLRSYSDVSLVERLLPEVYRDWSTDNYPEFSVEITFIDGSLTKVFSSTQWPLMLPWSVSIGERTHRTFDCGISRAIAKLVPAKFTNAVRLSDRALLRAVGVKVRAEIEDEWNWQDTINRLGPELATLPDKFVLTRSKIGRLSSTDAGQAMSRYLKGAPDYLNWNAEFSRKDLPPNVHIGVSLPYIDGKVSTFGAFRDRVDGFIGQALSVPWLSDYIRTHPESRVEIRFVDDRSFSFKGEESFWDSMRDGGQMVAAKAISDQLPKSTFVMIKDNGNWSFWLIMPDRRTVLWDFHGDTVLKWQQSDFYTWKRYDSHDWYGTFAVISPEGKIESR